VSYLSAVIVRHRVSPSASLMTGSGGRSSIPRPLESTAEAAVYWMPAFAGMTVVGEAAAIAV
jgi:hypothetical protein